MRSTCVIFVWLMWRVMIWQTHVKYRGKYDKFKAILGPFSSQCIGQSPYSLRAKNTISCSFKCPPHHYIWYIFRKLAKYLFC